MKRREFLKVCGAAVGLTVFGGADDKPLGGLNKEIQCKGGIVSSEYLKSHDLAVGETHTCEYLIPNHLNCQCVIKAANPEDVIVFFHKNTKPIAKSLKESFNLLKTTEAFIRNEHNLLFQINAKMG